MQTSFVRDTEPPRPADHPAQDGRHDRPDRCATRAGRLEAVRAAIADDADPNHRVAHAATLGLLGRADRAGSGGYPDWWHLFARTAATLLDADDWAVTVGVMANMVGVVDLADPADFVTTSALVERYGHRRVAAVQTRVDDLLGTGPDLPLATRVVTALSLVDEITEVLQGAGEDEDAATEVAQRCYQAGFWLVMADVDPAAPGPRLRTAEDLVRTWDDGGLRAWRAQAAILADNPWSPYGQELRALALAAGRPQHVHAIEEAVRLYRARCERRERELVAREIRALVAVSGLSQRDFAAMTGTSASRLSTYVNGLVTPSAAMMVRIRRISGLSHRRAGTPERFC